MTAAAEAKPEALGKLLAGAVQTSLAYLRKADPDAAAEVDTALRREVTRPAIVVVGETKRGKSSLVNALIGATGLSPVDVAVATSTYLEFVPAADAGARAFLPGRTEPVELGLADLRNWGTAGGILPDGTRPPRRIEVRHPAPLLEHLSLVDTPGTGGWTRSTPRSPWTRSNGPPRCCSSWTPPPRSANPNSTSSSRPANGSTWWCSR